MNMSVLLWLSLVSLVMVLQCADRSAEAASDGVPALGPAPKIDPLERQWAENWTAMVSGARGGAVQVECLAQGWADMRWNGNLDSPPGALRLGGKEYASGFGTHANSDIVVRTSQKARRLKMVVGVDDNSNTRLANAEKVAFSVVADGKTLWSCEPRLSRDGGVEADIDLQGVRAFHLIARTTGENIRYAHADWCAPVLTLEDGTSIDLARKPEFPGSPVLPPFSFRYGGKSSGELLPTWEISRESMKQEDGSTLHRVTWRDPQTKLECVMELQRYPDFPAGRWVVRFRNAGSADTPILEDIQALDGAWPASSTASLTYARGSNNDVNDFQILHARMPTVAVEMADGPITLGSMGGRPTTLYLPYFNVEDGERGVMIALGWTGQWSASFSRTTSGMAHVVAGMEKTYLVLHPGEEIRTPSVVMLFWKGQPIRGHNLFRQFVLHHASPHRDGQVVLPPLTMMRGGAEPSAEMIKGIQSQAKAGIGADVFWVDAGGYGEGNWYAQTGSWTLNRTMHPQGLVDVSDAARKAGMQLLLWAEPERAIWGLPVTKEHPEWFIGQKLPGNSVLLDLGNPQARNWAVETIGGLAKDLKLGWYRQDFNMGCLDIWRGNDAPDRQGMTEIRHVEGLYTFWDELVRRQPGLMIDNCAGGGRRLDLEMTQRSYPLWRTDYDCDGWEHDPAAAQAQTMGLCYWLPLWGTRCFAQTGDAYTFRSNFGPGMNLCGQPEKEAEERTRTWREAMFGQYRKARPFFCGDYYPLTTTSQLPDAWAAYQFHRPDSEAGFVMMLRRPESPYPSAQLKLCGLEPAATYQFVDADSGESITRSGKQAAAEGIAWSLEPRSSRLVFYNKVVAAQ